MKQKIKAFVLALLATAVIMIMASFLFSCTDNSRARNWGGTETIELPKGERLVQATWKETDLWYLTEPMPADYVPQVKLFKESSSLGMMEGTVKFVESR